MRVSSLSDPGVQRLIATYFVPLWHSRDSYQLANASSAERTELARIDRDRDRRGLPGGTVCVFLIAPDGHVAASLPVQQACQPEKLVPFLENYLRAESVRPRPREAVEASKAGTRALRPAAPPDCLVLHTWTRHEAMDPNRGTSQDWVVWTPAQWSKLVPAPDVAAGASWRVPREMIDQLAARC